MLNKKINELTYVAFDFETTGLYPDKDKIIEIGAVKFDLCGAEYRFSGLINPGVGIPEAASAVNGISDDMVADKPSIDVILPDFIEFIKDSVLVAHNIGFDAAFLRQSISDCGWLVPELPLVDTLALSRRHLRGYQRYTLESLAMNLGINLENAHRAEDDAAACMEVFLVCLQKVGGSSTRTLRDYLKLSGHPLKTLSKK